VGCQKILQVIYAFLQYFIESGFASKKQFSLTERSSQAQTPPCGRMAVKRGEILLFLMLEGAEGLEEHGGFLLFAGFGDAALRFDCPYEVEVIEFNEFGISGNASELRHPRFSSAY
jgi:hypothetical protein